MAKTIFAGTTEFGIPALEILKRDFGLTLVITQPDRPVGRKQIITPPPVKAWAEANGVKCIQPEKIIEAAEEIRSVGADAMVVAAYGQIIPQAVLSAPAKGSVNLHASLLPKYRGASPIQHAIMAGEAETGMTLMLMDELLDHGPILAQTAVPIAGTDDYTSLHAKLSVTAAKLLGEALPKYLSGELAAQEQDHGKTTVAPAITRAQARLDWTRPAREIHLKVRALNPEPGTWTTLGQKSVKILTVEEARDGRIELPGKIYASGRNCLVKCGDYSLKLAQVQPEGKKPQSGEDFLNGLKNLNSQVFV